VVPETDGNRGGVGLHTPQQSAEAIRQQLEVRRFPLPDTVSAPSRPAELQLSIHIESAIHFMTTEVNTKSWVTDILTNGYMPDFESLPTPYVEQNNKYKRDNMEIVREKIKGVAEGRICGTVSGAGTLLQSVRSSCEIQFRQTKVQTRSQPPC